MKIAFVNFVETPNLGDNASSPEHYFPIWLGHDVTRYDIREEIKEAPDLIVFGGGGLLHTDVDMMMLKTMENLKCQNPFLKTVIWGAGNNYDAMIHPHWHDWIGKFDLVGLRDVHSPWEYVPCASCMSSAFDRSKPEPIEPFVVYEHYANRMGLPYPTMTNTGERHRLSEAIDFLISGRVVLTNSYHGAYWAQLLCKPVIVLGARVNRFHCGLPIAPVLCPTVDFMPYVGLAVRCCGTPYHLIQSCRRLNRRFCDKVHLLMNADDSSYSAYQL